MSEPITAIHKPERTEHTPGPWGNYEKYGMDILVTYSSRIVSEEGDVIALIQDDNPNAGADAALIAQAPALLAHAEKSLEGLRLERDGCYKYKDWTNPRNGFVHYAGARAVLDSLDREIDELRALIAAARGEE